MISQNQQRARIDCLIFFALAEWGWINPEKNSDGSWTWHDPGGIMSDSHLGYPTRGRIWRASKAVKQTCPEEVKRYVAAQRELKEALKRHTATKTKKTWGAYKGLCQYATIVSSWRDKNWDDFYTRRFFRYRSYDLLTQKQERQRARKQIKEANQKLSSIKAEIFEKMQIPKKYRRKAL